MDISVTTNADQVSADLAATAARVWTAVKTRLQPWGARLQRYIASDKITSGGILEPRTGTLRRALFSGFVDQGATAVATTGVNLSIAPYGAIQEYGGTVSAKNAKNLTIPIGEALTAKGVARFSAREVISDPFSFGFDGTFVAKGILFGKVGKKAVLPLFILKPSVTLPAREYLQSSLDANEAAIVDDLTAAADEALA